MTSGTRLSPNPVQGYARRALIGSVAGYAMDGFDMLILAFMLPAIAADLHLTPSQSGSLVTWTLVGAMLGGVIFGILSDSLGRVKVLTWTILLFAVCTGLCALARGYGDLLVYRTVAGLGLGGEFGIGMALVAEAWPAEKRARVSSYVGIGWQAGVLLAALVTPVLLPLIGWRGMFACGLLPALVSFFIRRSLREPEIFQSSVAPSRRIEPLRLLIKDTATVKVTLGMFILCSVQNFGYYGIIIWLPSYLSNELGYSLRESAVWTSVTIVGMGCGIALFGHLADRFGRRPIFFLYQAGAAISVVLYPTLRDPVALLIGGAILGVFVNGMLGGYGALMSELYPTAARATAQNVLFNLGRAVGGFGPLVVGTLAARYSFGWTIALLAVIYIVDIIATATLIPERRNYALQ